MNAPVMVELSGETDPLEVQMIAQGLSAFIVISCPAKESCKVMRCDVLWLSKDSMLSIISMKLSCQCDLDYGVL